MFSVPCMLPEPEEKPDAINHKLPFPPPLAADPSHPGSRTGLVRAAEAKLQAGGAGVYCRSFAEASAGGQKRAGKSTPCLSAGGFMARWYHCSGRAGLEKQYDSYLKGADGGMQVEVNSLGQIVSTLGIKEPIAGKNLKLSIDAELQEFCNKRLVQDHLIEKSL